ncbi:hypothetical protein CEXT_93791 [Caerostris extrusa]|uniref:Uncharacterized protein n=1 Tax=Caerostris extrusa TaxID=172846 RepID=A0AAV4P7N5_CAEEX|nr:hypothetical protein CEXT_93791 [Caerostris extrusa]
MANAKCGMTSVRDDRLHDKENLCTALLQIDLSRPCGLSTGLTATSSGDVSIQKPCPSIEYTIMVLQWNIPSWYFNGIYHHGTSMEYTIMESFNGIYHNGILRWNIPPRNLSIEHTTMESFYGIYNLQRNMLYQSYNGIYHLQRNMLYQSFNGIYHLQKNMLYQSFNEIYHLQGIYTNPSMK